MIERIEWDKLTHKPNELRCPFMRGKAERQLRITFHSQSLTSVSEEEKAAIELLRELANLPQLEAFETSPGDFPHIVVGEPNPKDDFIPVELVHKDTVVMLTLVSNKGQWFTIAEQLVDLNRQSHETIQETFSLLILAQAHRSVGGDVLVTKSPLLLDNRSAVSGTNPRTPLEAAQLVGLFLRSRNVYSYGAGRRSVPPLDQGMFYWILARYRLPNMWGYFSACVAAGKTRHDDIPELGEAILVRAVRALEARDAIGVQFYMPQDNGTRDQMMYHFDYLTLVLAGAIDAQARVAHRAYRLTIKERDAGFRRDDFLTELVKGEAHELYEVVSSGTFKSLLTLLYEPRNTIHGAALKTMAHQGAGGPQHTFVKVPEPIGQVLLNAADGLGGAREWGLTSVARESGARELRVEPYSYATGLVKESLDAIDRVAAATDVSRLFQVGQTIPSLMDEAPKDSVFAWAERLSLLA
jgi:hypothetical protein